MNRSWTHTMDYEDALAMLLVAEDGMPIAEWTTLAPSRSRLLAGSQRREQVRCARSMLHFRDGAIADASFLSDLRAGNEAVQHDLVYARYLAATPVALGVGHMLLLPRRRDGCTSIGRDELERAVSETLDGYSAATIRRSTTSVRMEFGRAGVVRALNDGGLLLEQKRPAAVALYHLYLDDLAHRREASDAWLARESTAAAVFALSPDAVRQSIEELVAMGRLTRSYYSGEPRVLAA